MYVNRESSDFEYLTAKKDLKQSKWPKPNKKQMKSKQNDRKAIETTKKEPRISSIMENNLPNNLSIANQCAKKVYRHVIK